MAHDVFRKENVTSRCLAAAQTHRGDTRTPNLSLLSGEWQVNSRLLAYRRGIRVFALDPRMKAPHSGFSGAIPMNLKNLIFLFPQIPSYRGLKRQLYKVGGEVGRGVEKKDEKERKLLNSFSRIMGRNLEWLCSDL